MVVRQAGDFEQPEFEIAEGAKRLQFRIINVRHDFLHKTTR